LSVNFFGKIYKKDLINMAIYVINKIYKYIEKVLTNMMICDIICKQASKQASSSAFLLLCKAFIVKKIKSGCSLYYLKRAAAFRVLTPTF